MKSGYLAVALFGASLMMGTGACAQDNYGNGMYAPSRTASYPCNNTQFEQDQQEFEQGYITDDQFVDVCGMVTAVLPAKKTRSGNHGYFYVQLAPGEVIEIVSDLDQMSAPKWPWVAVGDTTYVQGRYYYDNDDSQGIDWTHHGTSSSWPHAGYVVVNGTKYQ